MNNWGQRCSLFQARTFRAVQGFDCPTRLIDKVLAVIVRQILGSDHTVEVGLEELLHEVHCGQTTPGPPTYLR